MSRVAIALLLIVTTHARADQQSLDTFLDACNERGCFNGVVLVAKKGEITHHRAVGLSTWENDEKLRPDSVFRLASVAKAFTGMSVLMLEAAGKLEYEDDVRKHLPELPYDGITIRHLLHHTSGLPDYVSLLEKHWDTERRGKPDRRIATSPDALAQLIEHKPKRRFAPGERWEYSNSGYAMLGLVVERVSGERFGDFLKKRIFDPLGMTNTVLFTPLTPPKIAHRAYGFRWLPDGLERAPNDHNFLNGMYGDGEVYSTAEDLLRWDQALYTEKLATREQLRVAFESGKLTNGKEHGYGFGWAIRKTDDRHVVSHGGAWVGFRTWIGRDLDRRRTIIVLTNDTSRSSDAVRRGVQDVLEGKKQGLPKGSIARVIAKELREGGVEKAAETYTRLKTKHPAEHDFSERRLRELGRQYLEQGKVDWAIAVLGWNAESFPKSERARSGLDDARKAKRDR